MDATLTAARAIHFAAVIAVAGAIAFRLLIAAPALRRAGIVRDPHQAALERALAWVSWVGVAAAVLSGAAWLVLEAGGMSGKPVSAVFGEGIVRTVLARTRFGHDWLVRLALGAGLAACLAAASRRPLARAAHMLWWAALALSQGVLVTLAWAGHASATEGWPGAIHLAADLVHLAGAGLWLGALPPLALLYAMARRAGDPGWAEAARLATARFSTLGVAGVGALLLTGIANTWFLAGTVPALVGTGYGQLLLLKIGLFLAMVSVATVNRLRLTPRLAPVLYGRKRASTWTAAGQLQRNAFIEAALGLGVLAIVGALGTLPPGLHQQPWWPFPYRLSLEVLAASSALRAEAIETGAIALIGLVLIIRGLRRTRWLAAAAGLVLLLGFGWRPVELMLVEANPTTFDRSPVPFTAMAVARGERSFVQNCAPCHGADGRGDGPLAKALPVPPADLTAPHVLGHPEGDLFWWIGNGFPNGAMPGFAASLGERQRWELVRFIVARAAAVQAHDLGPAVSPAVGATAPDFSFEAGDERQDSLMAAAAQGPVLLVFFGPGSTSRLDALAHWRHHSGHHGLRIVAVSLGSPEEAQAPPAVPPPDFVVSADPEVSVAYALYDHPYRAVPIASHVEFLIDRTGHVRARWHPGEVPDWSDLDALQRMADAMSPLQAAPASHAGHTH